MKTSSQAMCVLTIVSTGIVSDIITFDVPTVQLNYGGSLCLLTITLVFPFIAMTPLTS